MFQETRQSPTADAVQDLARGEASTGQIVTRDLPFQSFQGNRKPRQKSHAFKSTTDLRQRRTPAVRRRSLVRLETTGIDAIVIQDMRHNWG